MRTNAHGASDVAEGVLEAWFRSGALAVIVKPGDGFDVTSAFVFLAQGIVDVDVDDLRCVGSFCLGDEPVHLMDAESGSHFASFPGADAEKIGHIGSIWGFHKLPLQCSQRLSIFADQERVGHIQDMTMLWLTELDFERVQKRA
jgi:hypothetical protein